MSQSCTTPVQPRELYGVIGWPLGQSLSPLLHNAGFQALGLPAVYFRWEVEPEKLEQFMGAVRLLPIRGLSVTIPHKISIFPFLDHCTERARAVGAVNTVYWEKNRLCGDNTDVLGFMAPLRARNLDKTIPVLLLGAGGAAHAAAAGLKEEGFQNIFVTTPSNRSHLPLAEQFGLTPLNWEQRHEAVASLVINTTPLGMKGKHEGVSPYDFSLFGEQKKTVIAYDIVYNPVQTQFLQDAAAQGWETISGVEMFWGQGDAQFRCWTGQGLPDCARNLLLAALQQA